jgi:hypothetical protein
MAGASGMVFLGFGKYARADRIYALEPIMGDERGNGRRTLVWVEGIAEPIVAARTQETILEEMEQAAAAMGEGRRRRGVRGKSSVDHPHLFEA